jgi:MbtH protein
LERIAVPDWNEDPYDRYHVVVNDEEQYSIWPYVKQIPDGWREAGFDGPKDECLHHIDQVWTDMRPRSLRERMDSQQS